MAPSRPTALEAELRALCDAGDFTAAALLAIERYGAEVLEYLLTVAHSHSVASEVFAVVCDRLLNEIGKFRWNTSFRTWAYAIAFDAVCDSPHSRPTALQPRSPELAEAAERVRRSTLALWKIARKDSNRDLRAQLGTDEQSLLTLRLDRQMPWREIAHIMLGADDDASVDRFAATLRKRFERTRERLQALASQNTL